MSSRTSLRGPLAPVVFPRGERRGVLEHTARMIFATSRRSRAARIPRGKGSGVRCRALHDACRTAVDLARGRVGLRGARPGSPPSRRAISARLDRCGGGGLRCVDPRVDSSAHTAAIVAISDHGVTVRICLWAAHRKHERWSIVVRNINKPMWRVPQKTFNTNRNSAPRRTTEGAESKSRI